MLAPGKHKCFILSQEKLRIKELRMHAVCCITWKGCTGSCFDRLSAHYTIASIWLQNLWWSLLYVQCVKMLIDVGVAKNVFGISCKMYISLCSSLQCAYCRALHHPSLILDYLFYQLIYRVCLFSGYTVATIPTSLLGLCGNVSYASGDISALGPIPTTLGGKHLATTRFSLFT